MGLTKKSDGRYVVGKGIEDGNEYKGSAAWRDMVIQYSGDGATEKSLEYLTFLKDYALYHSAQGNPVIPPNVQIWMSTANTMKAVEADDITVDGETVKIGACTWDGSAWSFAEPTPGGGGSSLPPYTLADKGKFLGLGDGSGSETVVIVPEQTVTIVEGGSYLTNADFSSVSVGTRGTMTIDTDSFPVVAQDLDGMIDFMAEEGGESYSISTDGTDVFFETSITGTHTVSLTASVPSVEPKWEGADENSRFLAIYDDETSKTYIDASFSELHTAFEKSKSVEIYEKYEGVEYSLGIVSQMSLLTAPVLWLNFDNSGEHETTAIATSVDAKPTFEIGLYGVDYIEFTLTGSTWSCDHTLAQLEALGVGAPVGVDLPIAGVPTNKMILEPVLHMTYGKGISCSYDSRKEPFTALANEKFNIAASVFQSTIDVTAHKYSVSVTDTDLLA